MNCEVFALCENEATGTFPHPVLDKVPSCQRCADKLDKQLTPFPKEATDGPPRE